MTDIQLDKATDADTYAEGWDKRNYVAYLVADGNNMGKIFSACLVDQRTNLSGKISKITAKALAAPMKLLRNRDPLQREKRLPALPLILGGDDVFVLMPAPWAFDVARTFAEKYEELMNAELESLGIELRDDSDNRIKATIGVAMVICKASYPYRHAHEYGEGLLEAVKDEAKKRGESMIVVDWIVGSDVMGTTRPHHLTLSEAKQMNDRRFDMRIIPNSFLHQLQEHLETAPGSDGTKLNDFLKRRKRSSSTFYEAIQNARTDLSDDRLMHLLRLWEFAYDASRRRDEYLSLEEWA